MRCPQHGIFLWERGSMGPQGAAAGIFLEGALHTCKGHAHLHAFETRERSPAIVFCNLRLHRVSIRMLTTWSALGMMVTSRACLWCVTHGTFCVLPPATETCMRQRVGCGGRATAHTHINGCHACSALAGWVRTKGHWQAGARVS